MKSTMKNCIKILGAVFGVSLIVLGTAQFMHYGKDFFKYLRFSEYPETNDIISHKSEIIRKMGFNFEYRAENYLHKYKDRKTGISIEEYLYVAYTEEGIKDCSNESSNSDIKDGFLSCSEIEIIKKEFPKGYIGANIRYGRISDDYTIYIYVPIKDLTNEEFEYYDKMRGIFPKVILKNKSNENENRDFCLNYKRACDFVYYLED